MMIPETFSGPGLVDLQLNGFAGFDFNSDWQRWSYEGFQKVSIALRNRGVVHALPTLITDDTENMIARARAYNKLVTQYPDLLDVFPGLHVEGPFISPEDGPRGAHPFRHCKLPVDCPGLIDQLEEASGGKIKMITVAPELKGALILIAESCAKGIIVALGHTLASPEVLNKASLAGARISTHLGNGSHQMLPRLDNYVQHQLANDFLMASFIADGHHVPFPTLKNFIRAKTPARTILVTDAIAAAGEGPGQYKLGSQTVVVDEALRCQIGGQPNLAGSALTLDRAVLNTARYCDVSFDLAWQMASSTPALLLGLKPIEVHVSITSDGFYRSN